MSCLFDRGWNTVDMATTDLNLWQVDPMSCLFDRGWNGHSLKATNQGMEIVGEEGPK
jgi:hypothetical protein